MNEIKVNQSPQKYALRAYFSLTLTAYIYDTPQRNIIYVLIRCTQTNVNYFLLK